MALNIIDRVLESSTTTGTGTYNLDGATADFQTFVAGIGDTNTCFYCAFDSTGWEVGIGTVTDAALTEPDAAIPQKPTNSTGTINLRHAIMVLILGSA